MLVYEGKEWSMKMSSGGVGAGGGVQSNFVSSYGKHDQNRGSLQVSSNSQVANTNAASAAAVSGAGGYPTAQYPTAACKMVDEHRFSSGQQMLNLLHHGSGSGSMPNGSTTTNIAADHHSTFQYSSNGGPQISSGGAGGGGSCMNEQTFAHPHHPHHSHPHHPHPHHPHQSWSSTPFAGANSLASGRNLVADSAAAAAAAASWPHNMTSFMSANGAPSYQPATAAYFI